MRKLLLIACAALAACASYGQKAYVIPVAMSTNASASVTYTGAIEGAVDTIYIAVSGGVVTGDVGVIYAPHHGTTAVQSLVATNRAVTGSDVFRPRVTGHDTDGNALVGVIEEGLTNVVSRTVVAIPRERVLLAGESVTVRVQGSPTGVTWRAVIVTE